MFNNQNTINIPVIPAHKKPPALFLYSVTEKQESIEFISNKNQNHTKPKKTLVFIFILCTMYIRVRVNWLLQTQKSSLNKEKNEKT